MNAIDFINEEFLSYNNASGDLETLDTIIRGNNHADFNAKDLEHPINI